MPALSVVIPAYNEEASIGAMLGECVAALDACGQSYDITVVNDGSADGTAKVIDEWSLRCPGRIKRIDHDARKGLSQAVETAFICGEGECVLLLHADGQYPPASVVDCLRLMRETDIVVFVRREKFYGPWRRLLSAGYRLLPALFFGVDLRDPGGAKCLRRGVLQNIQPCSSGVFRDPERIIRAVKRGYRVAFLPVDSRQRHSGVAQGGRMMLAAQSVVDVCCLWWQTAICGKRW